MNAAEKVVYQFGGFRLDLANKQLLQQGQVVPLTPKVFDTLVLLVEHAGQLVEKDEFMRRVWPAVVVEESALAENISRIRRALQEDDEHRFIATVHKRGYRFVAPVSRVDVPASAGAPIAASAPLPAQPARGRKPWILGATVLAVVLLVAAAGFYLMPRATTPAAPIRSLAVLPLENLSGDPEQEYFADGMTDELITQLAKIHALRVISRTSVSRYKGTRKGLPAVASELGVDAVVEGTVFRSQGRVRVTAQVVRANPEAHLWAERYDRELGDLVTLQGELASEIAQAISVQLTPQEHARLTRGDTLSTAAHEAFLKGRFYWAKRTEAGTRRALEYYQQAVAADPRYAVAYTGIADSYISLALPEALQEALPPEEAFPQAQAAALRALSLDDTLAEAHASLGHIKFQYERDWPGAEREFRRALELNPNYANAHLWYALSLLWLGRLDESLDQVRRARELDPLSLVINANHCFILAGMKRYGEAVEQCHRTLEMDARFALGHYRLGQTLELQGDYAHAVTELQQAVTDSGNSPRAIAELGLTFARLGQRAEATKLLDRLQAERSTRYVSAFDIAVVYAALGSRREAQQWLDKSFAERSPSLSLLELSPAFSEMRQDPQFVALVKRVGLP